MREKFVIYKNYGRVPYSNRGKVGTMKVMMRIGFAVCMAVSFLFSGVSDAASPEVLQRFALVVGSNTGTEDRVELKYAVSDAELFARVLKNLGGVRPEHVILIGNPDLDGVNRGFDRLEAMVADEVRQGRGEVIFYYSGHADEVGIILGRSVLPYAGLRGKLDSMNVDVRIAVLDACASGTLTREKGGQPGAPFLFDVSSEVQGHAYLTSSSHDEAAQESDRIKGSFFTHYLVSGLLGGADANSDGKVTLNEVYQFAFHETLRRTETTKAGPQHAAYDIRLKGSGDLVMTDLRASSAGLRLVPSLHGRIFVRDTDGNLLAELNKRPGKMLELGLEPGKYTITLEKGSQVLLLHVSLHEGKYVEVREDGMRRVEKESSVDRGKSSDIQDAVPRRRPLAVSVIPLPTFGRKENSITNVALSLVGGHQSVLKGLALTGGITVTSERASGGQFALAANITTGSLKGLQFAGLGNLVTKPSGGLQLTFGVNSARDFRGLQIACIGNSAGDFGGLQIAPVNFNFKAGGVQVTAGQLSLLTNIVVGSVQGIQFAGLSNFAARPVTGSQITFGANFAGRMNGCQMAGVANLAGRVRGLQFAPLNFGTKVHGVQVGLINICDSLDGIPVGIMSVVKSNPPRLRLWIDDLGIIYSGVRSGSESGYSLFSIGTRMSGSPWGWAIGFGTGFSLPIKKVSVSLEIRGSLINEKGENIISDTSQVIRLSPGLVGEYRFFRHFALWGGIMMNFDWASGHTPQRMALWKPSLRPVQDMWFGVSPGFVAGVEF